MSRYAPRCQSINDLPNILPLRADLHWSFGQLRFVIVPKPVASDIATESTRYALAVHMLDSEELEDIALYRNLALQTYSDNRSTREYVSARPFFFARFALALFGQLLPFLQSAPRHVLVPSPAASGELAGPLAPCLPTWTQINAGMKSISRSQSGSRKRSASQMSRQDDADDDDDCDDAELRRCTRIGQFQEPIVDAASLATKVLK